MKYPSDLLYRLARAVGSAELNGSEASLEVPHALLPMVRIPGGQPRLDSFSVTAIQRESFVIRIRLGRAASQAAASSIICTFGRGLWKVRMLCSYISNFTAASDGTVTRSALYIRDPGASVMPVATFLPISAVPQYLRLEFEMLLMDDAWDFFEQAEATGVAQTHEIDTTVWASRLL